MAKFFKGKNKKAEMPDYELKDGVLKGVKVEHAERLMSTYQTIFFDKEGHPLDLSKPGTKVYNLRGDPVSPYAASLIFDAEGNEIMEYDAYFNEDGDLVNQNFKGVIYDERGTKIADSIDDADAEYEIVNDWGDGYGEYYTPPKPKKKYGGLYGSPSSYNSIFNNSYDSSKGSLTSSVFSKFGNYGYSSYSYMGGKSSMSKDQWRYKAALNSVARSANIVDSGEKGKDQHFQVKWSSGEDYNQIKGNTVFLSPDVINEDTTLKPDWTNIDEKDPDGKYIDVLTGQAMIESCVKRTADPEAEQLVNDEAKDALLKMKQKLWYASETMHAQDKILEDWPGFRNYFATKTEYYTDTDCHKKTQEILDESVKDGGSAEAALQALLWQMIHPDEALEIPEIYEEALNEAAERIGDADTSMDRAKATQEIIKDFATRWVVKEEEEESDEGGGEGSGSEMPNPGLDRNQMTGKADNSTDEDLGKQSASSEDPEEDGDPSGIPGCAQGDEHPEGFKDRQITDKDLAEYRRIVKEQAPFIRALKDSIKLKNERASLVERGLRSGTLDEGSVFKLGFYHCGYEDNRIFEYEDIIDKPKMAFGILVDESGSMSGCGHTSSREPKYMVVRKLAITIANAFNEIDGVDMCVVGHTTGGYSDRLLLNHYYTPNGRNLEGLATISAYSSNLDGWAMDRTLRFMENWFADYDNSMLIHIHDGYPCGHGYGGMDAKAHMLKVCRDYRAKGVEVIGIGVDAGFDRENGNSMYGPNKWACIDSPKTVGVISTLITKAVQSACMV